MKRFKINYLKPGAEQMGKMMHLECTLFLHISPDSQWLHGSSCRVHKKLKPLDLVRWSPVLHHSPTAITEWRENYYSVSLFLSVTIRFEKNNQGAGLQPCEGISWLCLSSCWNSLPGSCRHAAMGGNKMPHHDLISHWAPGIPLSQLNICLRAGQKVAQKLLLRVNNSLSKLLASALYGGNRGFTVSY